MRSGRAGPSVGSFGRVAPPYHLVRETYRAGARESRVPPLLDFKYESLFDTRQFARPGVVAWTGEKVLDWYLETQRR